MYMQDLGKEYLEEWWWTVRRNKKLDEAWRGAGSRESLRKLQAVGK